MSPTSSSPTAPFPQAQPNQSVEFAARDPGVLDRFADGEEAEWAFTGQDWKVGVRSPIRSDPFAATARRRGFASPDMAVSVEMEIDDGAWAAIGNGDTFVSWSAARRMAIVPRQRSREAVLAQSAGGPARRWLFAMIDKRATLFADGVKLFDQAVPSTMPLPDGLVLSASGGVRFRQLIALADPIASFTFTDGGAKPRQTVRLLDGTTGVRSATLYDSLGRKAAETLSANSTGDLAFAYDTGFVTNAGPDGSLWSGAPLTGTLAGAYPEAGGYPFRRDAFEASPLSRPIARGEAGAEFALKPDQSHAARLNIAVSPPAMRPICRPANTTPRSATMPTASRRPRSPTPAVRWSDPRRSNHGGSPARAEASFHYDAKGPPFARSARVQRPPGKTCSRTRDLAGHRTAPIDAQMRAHHPETAAATAEISPYILRVHPRAGWPKRATIRLRGTRQARPVARKADGDPASPPARHLAAALSLGLDGGRTRRRSAAAGKPKAPNDPTADVTETTSFALDGTTIEAARRLTSKPSRRLPVQPSGRSFSAGDLTRRC